MGAKEAKSDEFEHVREYLPCLSVSEPSTDVVVDTMAAALARAAELMHAEAGAPKAVDVITTDDRKKLLFERKEQERLAKEKAEREAAEAELKKAMEEAREKTKPDLLAAPLRRAKRAVEASVPLIIPPLPSCTLALT